MLNKRCRPRPQIEELEPRLLFSADLAPLAVDALQPAPEQRVLNADGEFSNVTTAARHELVIVDAGVDGYETLLAAIVGQAGDSRHFDVVVLDNGRDGVEQISEALAQRNSLDALHLISHGESGSLQLGAGRLDAASLEDRADDIAAWATAFDADADILLYGCDVAAGDIGREFVSALASLTGADVTASTDKTGNERRGGDWTLEASTGRIETVVAVDAAGQSAWGGVLGDEFRVNATINDDQTTDALTRGSQQAVAFDAGGNYVVVWTSKNQDGNGDGVYARRFAADGTSTGEIQVNETISGDQNGARVVSDSAGNFVVTWTSLNQDGDAESVCWRRFAADGTALTAETRANDFVTGRQQNAVIAMNSGGEFVIAWEGQGTGDTYGIWFRRYAADGTALDATDQRANPSDAGGEANPVVAMSIGGFVIGWESPDQDASGNDIVFRRFAANGTALDAAGVQVDSDVADVSGAAIAMDATGNFTIVYRSEVPLLNGVWGHRFNAAGVPTGGVFAVAFGDASSPSIAMAADGAFVVVYQKTGANGVDVCAHKYNANGSANGGAFTVNQSIGNDQLSPSVALRDIDNFVVVWNGYGSGDPRGVYARTYETNVPPMITSNGGGAAASVSVAENTAAVTTVTAVDADLPAQTLSYGIIGGADAVRFGIDGVAGTLTFVAAPDYELPVDANGDNTYEVIVRASDGSLTDTQAISVSVTDVQNQLTVTTTADTVDGNTASIEALNANRGADGLISLREAIIAANNTLGADLINLPAGSFVLSLSGSESNNAGNASLNDLDITGDLTILGAGSGSTVIDGNVPDRVFQILSGASATFADFTVQGGAVASNNWGGGVLVDNGAALSLSRVIVAANTAGSGAGIYSYGTLTAYDTVFSGNTTSDWGGGLMNDGGSMALERVTVNGNIAGRDGGGIYNFGQGAALSLRNVTISGNTASGLGGGLYSNRDVTADHATIAFNAAASGGGAYVQNPGNVSLVNSLVALNSAAVSPDMNGVATSLGHNLIGGTMGNSGWAASDLQNIDPLLSSALSVDGGYTATHELLAGSPAIDAGVAGVLFTDQRHAMRDAAPDIGAYEVVPSAPPTTDDTAAGGNEDAASITVTLSGVDGAGIVASFRLVNLPANGRLYMDAALTTLAATATEYGASGNTLTLYFVPDPDWSGSSDFQYAAANNFGLSDSSPATASLTVNPENDAPVVANAIPDQAATEDAPFSYTFATDVFSDVDAGDTLTYTASGVPSWLTFNAATRSFTGTPANADVGAATITVRATDLAGAFVEDDFVLVVANTNDAPEANVDTVSGNEDTTITANVLGNDTDVENDTLTAVLVSGPAHGSLTPNTDGSFSYTPNADWNGADSFTYVANDGVLDSNIATVTITVNPVNDAPAVVPVTLGSINEDSSRLITQADLLAGATDADGDALAAANLNAMSGGGTLRDNGDGTWTFAPAANWNGVVDFSFEVSDGTTVTANTATLTVNSVNDTPTTIPLTMAAIVVDSDGRPITQAELLANAGDADGDALTASGLAIAAGAGTLMDNGDGTWTYIPAANDDTAVSFRYTIGDGTASVAGTATLDITPPTVDAAIVVTIESPSGKASAASASDKREPVPDKATAVASEAVVVAARADNDGQVAAAELPSDQQILFAPVRVIAIMLNSSDSNMQRPTTPLEPPALNEFNVTLDNGQALQALQTSLGSQRFQEQLDQLQDDVRQQLSLDKATVASTLAVSTGLSVGYVLWLVRGGVLLSSLLSSLPAWRLIDPLPILGHLGRRKDDDADDDSLAGMLKKSAAKSRSHPQPTDGPGA